MVSQMDAELGPVSYFLEGEGGGRGGGVGIHFQGR